MSLERIGRFLTFATLGTLNVSQRLASSVLSDIETAEPDVVAEETLCLVSTATARAASVALKDDPEIAGAASAALLEIPFSYRDYLIGERMLENPDEPPFELADQVHGQVYARLSRKREFYGAHFPPDRFPVERTLRDKMSLWMGRVSPPGLPETPIDRLRKLDLVSPLSIHLKLIVAHGRQPAERT